MRTLPATTFLRSSLFLSALVLFPSVVACSAETASNEGAEHAGEALASGSGGGGGSLGWGCAVGGDTCTCTGDVDCNDMFGSGICGDKAICQVNSDGVPKCVCVMADVGKPPPVSPISPIHGIGTLPIAKSTH